MLSQLVKEIGNNSDIFQKLQVDELKEMKADGETISIGCDAKFDSPGLFYDSILGIE